MTAPIELQPAMARIVADLMPISAVVAGPGAVAVAAALEASGAGAELFGPEGRGPFDLALLLVEEADAPGPDVLALIEGLAAISDRILFTPSPPGAKGAGDMAAWFEALAEHGFQPVVEYDASFLGQGAFLVDRNATAAEAELTAFAERMSLGGALAASTERVAVLEAELAEGGDRAALKAKLAARDSELESARARLAAWQNRAEAAETDMASLRAHLEAWQALGAWIRADCAAPERSGLEALRRAAGRAKRRRFLFWRRDKAAPQELALMAQAAQLRADPRFDPLAYLARRPELLARGGDPVWDCLLQGGSVQELLREEGA